MVSTNTFLKERWSSLHSRGCGHPNMWHQSKLRRPLRKRLQNEFIQRQLRRERESRLGNYIRQIYKDCKEMLKKKIEEIEVCNSALTQTQSHKTDFMIEGTDEGNWDRTWYINKNIRRHVCSNKDLFGKLKEKFIVKKLQGNDKLMFIHGIEEINIKIRREIFCIPGVQYTPDVTLNILSTDQLKAQGMDLAFKNNKCRLVYMFKDPENCKFDESKIKMMQNKYLSDYYKLLEENPDYEEGKCEEIRHYAYACLTKTTTVGYIPKGGDYVYVKEHCKGATIGTRICQKKTTIFIDQGKELTYLQGHCGDQEDQVTAPVGQDRICQEKNKVEHFGIELEDIEEIKKGNQHQATYQMKTKDHFEKGSTSIATKKDERDTNSSSSDDFIIIS
uniref:ARID DNA-binding domain-containing protein n=1 Tax=Tanacetum cinerariifolium TaxID=118510 RepID=A0A6L2KLM2_TANCI|nr:ARID DNA-binding domain-containing protein [Tanacetum cinerariifolium]